MPITPSKLVSFLTSTDYAAINIAALISNRAHYTKIPQRQANRFPRIYFERSDKNSHCDIDGSVGGYVQDEYSLEIISNNPDEVIQIADYFWSDIHGHFGAINSSDNVKGILLQVQSDDYEPKGTGGDLGLDYATLVMRVISS